MSSPEQDQSLRGKKRSEDMSLDLALRPKSFDEYVGQEKVKNNLKILIEAAKRRKEPLEHLLFYGPAGLGKTTLAHLVARETASQIKITSGPAIEKVGDLASILTNLSPKDILFIDEAHRLNKLIEEILYPAMENRSLDIIIGKGPSARTIQLELPPFTLVAATTRIALLSSPLRSRFSGGSFRLDFYNQDDIERIIKRSAGILHTKIEPGAIPLIASRSRFTPRIANRLLKRARDYSEVKGQGIITSALAEEALKLLEIDKLGLESLDRKILDTIIQKFAGGPVGLGTVAASVMEEEDTIEEVYEPYLMQLGFLERTPRGRCATARAYEHLGLNPPQNQRKLI
ncbi:Holliday junction DNA helicase RuvB [Candidatus Giovannonibacteria bacterium RIFCSPLOWO2_12_FULL_44_25]|uniref:Holliday junction branch migration complex subunit RuvB n=3 Tax=Candidatus Giovannoniibacteriota TaxID=1752738 RepID=A0A1F5W6M4_9BACT|nr:MAG: Holliday junction DNA helicase RuvB [Candidatus Giovannonibacteria bacterium GWA2_45_15]OGF59923.1 MAG: Holliday junction DNA helicase RuvB [Candidatus Giovannonibacteria bacterium RIFCSPHIGHO2_01_45_12]OGF61130.1 MAG: Holliday junction DNA helicase RuvB [Candidatus Giovannonibacteria bacterium RIFCSPHIGHO2_01_FULL_44_100]OGF71326.1 MAG: Holliday junction DNA helicase RuvB [Candidatus Giovannonibacteria bacterium RIFCSPHIGHO2_02_FULL_45_40]OGF84025.1 MAG: Holliday junction DNA helicase 